MITTVGRPLKAGADVRANDRANTSTDVRAYDFGFFVAILLQ